MNDVESKIVSLTQRRLRESPVIYSIVFRHDHEGMSFIVHDIQDTKNDRLAVARDLQAAAKSLLDEAVG